MTPEYGMSVDGIYRFLETMPRLKHLKFGPSFSHALNQQNLVKILTLQNLVLLDIGKVQKTAIDGSVWTAFKSLDCSNPLPALRCLEVRDVESNVLREMLPRLALLQRICLTYTDRKFQDLPQDLAVPLSSCPSLKEIEIIVSTHHVATFPQEVVPNLMQIIGQACPAIEYFGIHTRAYVYETSENHHHLILS